MSDLTRSFCGFGPLRGRLRVPGDKSISHRGLLFGALSEGRSTVRGLSTGDDVLRMAEALRGFGIRIEGSVIEGGRERFVEPERPLDLGNSGTATRLLTGLAATFPFLTILVGDASVHRRPMERILAPLRDMGARIDGRNEGRLAPIVVRGGSLIGIDFTPPVPSAQVKGAILLAGLGANGETIVRERTPTRRHTEELLEIAGAPVRIVEEEGSYAVAVRPATLQPFELDVPGDPSQAAFLAVAASIVPDSEITIEHVYVGPGRDGFLTVLARMGADVEIERQGRNVADLHVRHAKLRATTIEGSEVASCIDELPVLAVAAAFAEGTTTIRDAAELRVKESDRIETVVAGLRAIGATAEGLADGLVVDGTNFSPSGHVDSAGDHRVAMAFAVAGIASEHEVEVSGFDSVETSWPGFARDLEGLCRS